jgi:hypothetical protein
VSLGGKTRLSQTVALLRNALLEGLELLAHLTALLQGRACRSLAW